MTRVLSGWIVSLLVTLAAAPAQDEGQVRRLELRVVSSFSRGTAVIDRGRGDLVAVGDRVELVPRQGGRVRGTVVNVEERTSVVELEDREYAPALGTRGEVLLPRSRTPGARPAPPPHLKPEPQPEAPASRPATEPPPHPPWKTKDDEFKQDQPLLTQVRAVRPEEREVRFSGRAYGAGDLTRHPESEWDESFLRAGTDLRLDNPFHGGGSFRFNAEFDARTESNDVADSNILLHDLSYQWGGTRFNPMRYQVGRFLQHAMPEFGTVDGVEWNWRLQNGHRLGASFGFMPVPDRSFDGSDMQLSLHWLWAADVRETLTVGAGYQKTLDSGSSDRDLLVLKSRYLPIDQWQLDGTLWIDVYTGGDAVKGPGIEVSQVVASASRQWTNGNRLLISYRRLVFPDITRKEFTPLLPNLLADDRADRLAADLTIKTSDRREVRTYFALFDDEEHFGAAGELAVDSRDMLWARSRTVLAAFGNTNQFSSIVGGRVDWTKDVTGGRWNVLFETALNHEYGIENSYNDLLHHRLRVTRDFYQALGFDLTLYTEGRLVGEDVFWSIGFQFQKSF